MAKKEEEEKPVPTVDPDDEFFTAEGVTDQEEKDAIRSRARVLRYAAWRTERDNKGKDKPKPGSSKPWYKKD